MSVATADKFTDHEINLMFFNSFRYCLGRRTYAVSEFVDMALKHWGEIQSRNRFMIRLEIKNALDKDQAGAAMDREQWERLLDYANKYDGIK